ncbi:MAG: ATP phosphoribosyltransferase regulatory subunit [Clostridiales bacterium]|nr:ATP phosphoribosyltransferase regulatory subunit [Clostridiales bacterium]
MTIPDGILKREERVLLALRALYRQNGYTQYKMRKFEEYDLYADNRDFLVSGSVITFHDTDGKLLALKPDVTLSIVRSGRDEPDTVQKVYYQENVYRVAGYSRSFREIMQAGVECIGAVDACQLAETLFLAAKSLSLISGKSVLALSHLGAVSRIMELAGLGRDDQRLALGFISRKSLHELSSLCKEKNTQSEAAAGLLKLAGLSGSPEEVLPVLEEIGCSREAGELKRVTDALKNTDVYASVRIDFSVVNDPAYYNGLVFQGYVDGIPERVISGGQYDRLMRKMGRQANAIGFAVYLDTLEHLEDSPAPDADILLVYPAGSDASAVLGAARKLQAQGKSVSCMTRVPQSRRFGQVAALTAEGDVRYES